MDSKKKIAILYIATGRYTIFWKEFYQSMEKYFLPNHDKYYFIYTDSNGIFEGENTGKIQKVYQPKLGWPYDTLMRFEIFLKAEEELKKMDYIFFFNANMELVDTINDEEIFNEEKPLIGAKHPYFFNSPAERFTYDRNPNSLAFIEMGGGKYYFMGGLNGGKAGRYLELIHTLKQNIQIDLDNGVIALWHDESHINRYFLDNEKEVLVLSEKYGVPEEQVAKSFYKTMFYRELVKDIGGKIVIRNKAHFRYGGHRWLRGIEDKQSVKNKIKKTLWDFLRKGIM